MPIKIFGLLTAIAAPVLLAQTTPASYTVSQINSMAGAPITQLIYHNGSKTMIETDSSHARTLYDLETHRNFTWYTADPSTCSGGTFSGDWGDPFKMSAELISQIKNGKPLGNETVNGVPTKVVEAIQDGNTVKAWIEPKSGLLMKAQLAAGSEPPKVLIEVKQFTPAAPAASVFVLPAGCAAAASAPKVPTEAERIASEVGNAADFANAIYGPGSKASCTVLFRVVKAGSMQPVTSGFQAALDRTVDVDHAAHYVMGVSTEGIVTYSGGGLHEVTAQVHNGVLRIDSVPSVFYLAVAFGKGGEAGGNFYRQCVAPETVLLYVVKNPGNLSEGGDFLWVKSGKLTSLVP
jgi:hypothetical protein